MSDAEPKKNTDKPTPPGREVYEAPTVTYTEISANEALMGICKGGLGMGPYGPGCPGGCSGGGS